MQTPSFIHIRVRDENGRPLTHGGATLAYAETSPNVIEIAEARCNPRDNFNRRIGRAISAGRLNKQMIVYRIQLEPGTHSRQEIFRRIQDFVNLGLYGDENVGY